ncbi:MAG: class I SAM-dependent methyltransferase [Chloroflexota bacterium]|nr:class I SAM-dependent methyltransferase [Chloroflexota bacterium]
MMVRLDFTGRAGKNARALRVASQPAPGVTLVAQADPRLPFRDDSVDELFIGRAIAYREDVAATLDELWRVSKPGALIHLTLPHASSAIAVSRDARPRPLLTLQTFAYYDPRTKPADAPKTTFAIERARLRVAGQRGDDSGLALARGPFAQFVEKLANSSRGSQYRFERWFAGLIGGFEEFDVVLSAVKQSHRASAAAAAPRAASLRATSDVAHEAALVEPEIGAVAANVNLPGELRSSPPGEPLRGVPERS